MSSGKKAPRKFELNDVRTIGRQLLEGLKFLHDKGIGHGKVLEIYYAIDTLSIVILQPSIYQISQLRKLAFWEHSIQRRKKYFSDFGDRKLLCWSLV